MQLVATAAEMRGFDREAITKYGISGILLMENAGRAFVDSASSVIGSPIGLRVSVFCGKGNNGGDGFVIARHLASRGAHVTVYLVGRKSAVRGDAAANLKSVVKLASREGGGIRFVELTSLRQLSRVADPHVVIDALLGTGFSGALTGIYRELVRWMNRGKSTVVAVDIPSGVNADTGAVESVAVKADATITMGLAKVGHYVGEGREHTGTLSVVDIGIPSCVFSADRVGVFRVTQADVRSWLPVRPASAHKHSVGKIFVLAGSRGLTGAPFMTAQSAMKSGAGAVVLGVPSGIYQVLARKSTEVMVTPLDETAAGSVASSAAAEILERCRWADVVVVGPGLSRDDETQRLIRDLLPKIMKPVVLDADGLATIGKYPGSVRDRNQPTVLTPHVGEMSRMTGVNAVHIEASRVGSARAAAARFGSILVLKGSPTATATPDGKVFLNGSGNPGMATAGSGDVLTGIIASMIGQGMSPAQAAAGGVCLHGLAGDEAARRFGMRGMLAMDILNQIPETMKVIEESAGSSF